MRSRADRFMKAGVATVAKLADSALRVYDGYKWATYPGRNPNNLYSEKNNKMPPTPRYTPKTPSTRSVKRLLFQSTGSNKKPRLNLKVSQSTQTKRRSIRTVPLSSRSGGKLKVKKYKPSKRSKTAIKGIEHTYEVNKEFTTTAQTGWVGHSVTSPELVRYTLWRLIIKRLMAKTGNGIRFFGDDPSVQNVQAGDKIVLYFQNQDGNAGTIDWTYGGTGTWESAVTTFATSAFLHAEGVLLKSITFLSLTDAQGNGVSPPLTRLDLEHSYVTMYCKSSMKMQNRTVNGTDTSMDDVDNVPLYGRAYGGSGNGAIWYGRVGSPNVQELIAHKNYGYIENNGVNDAGLQEPLHQIHFKYVTKKGKVHLDPGYIKTSVLTYKKTISCTALNRRISQICTSNKVRDSFGVFRFFGLERMIDVGLENNIKLGIEINHYISMNMYTKYKDITIPLFTREALP